MLDAYTLNFSIYFVFLFGTRVVDGHDVVDNAFNFNVFLIEQQIIYIS